MGKNVKREKGEEIRRKIIKTRKKGYAKILEDTHKQTPKQAFMKDIRICHVLHTKVEIISFDYDDNCLLSYVFLADEFQNCTSFNIYWTDPKRFQDLVSLQSLSIASRHLDTRIPMAVHRLRKTMWGPIVLRKTSRQFKGGSETSSQVTRDNLGHEPVPESYCNPLPALHLKGILVFTTEITLDKKGNSNTTRRRQPVAFNGRALVTPPWWQKGDFVLLARHGPDIFLAFCVV